MIWISAAFLVLSIVLDQVTKIIAESNLQGTDGFVVIPKVLSFYYVENKGAAFGMFSENRWVFMVFSTVAIVAMIYVLITSKNKNPLFVISLSMLIGGGIGNMIDRVLRGYVIDFLKVLFVDFAVFNIADCFVTIGAFLLAFYLLFIYKETESASCFGSLNESDKDSKCDNCASNNNSIVTSENPEESSENENSHKHNTIKENED